MRLNKHVHSFNSFMINEGLQEQGIDATPELIEAVKRHVNLLIYGDKTGTEGILIRKADTGRTEQQLEKDEAVKETERKAKIAEANPESPTLAEDWRFNIFKLLQKLRETRGGKVAEMFFTRATGSDVLPWTDAQVLRWGLLLLNGDDDDAKYYKKNTDEQYRFTSTDYSVKGKGDLIFSGDDGDLGFPEFAVAKASKADWLHRFDESEIKKSEEFEENKEIWYLGGEQIKLPFDVTISFFDKSTKDKDFGKEKTGKVEEKPEAVATAEPKSTYVKPEEAQELETPIVEPEKKGSYKPVDQFGNFEIIFQINYHPKDTITNETGEQYIDGSEEVQDINNDEIPDFEDDEEGQGGTRRFKKPAGDEEGVGGKIGAKASELRAAKSDDDDEFKDEEGVPKPIKRRGKGADNFGGAF